MKLATLKNGSRDGQLVVVSRDLTHYTDASFLVPSLQAALDGWARIAPHLEAMAEGLDHGSVPSLRFHEHDAESPLPRAYQWVVAAGAEGKAAGSAIAQRASDGFIGPRDTALLPAGISDVVSVGGVAVIIDDVPMGATREEALDAIQLVMLASELSQKGGGLPAAFSPVAVTLDELEDLWADGKFSPTLLAEVNGSPIELGSSGAAIDFPAIIAQAAKARPLSAGTIVGTAISGAQVINSGDKIRIEVKDAAGHSVFGAIEQAVERHNV